MDPLSAVGLAGAIVQFVSFSREVVSLGKEIYKSPSGTRQESIEIGTMLQDLSELHTSFRHHQHGTLENSSTLSSLVDQCEPIYAELQKILGSLEAHGSNPKWSSLRAAVKVVWKEKEMNDMEKRLRRLQRQIDSHLISDIR
jgi:hypothetical protein